MANLNSYFGFSNNTSCSNGISLFIVPGTYDGENGIDKCIIKHAQGLDPLIDKQKIVERVQANCINTDKNQLDRKLYCVPKPTLEILKDTGLDKEISSQQDLLIMADNCPSGMHYHPGDTNAVTSGPNKGCMLDSDMELSMMQQLLWNEDIIKN